MSKLKIAQLAVLTLLLLPLAGSGIADLAMAQPIVQNFQNNGLPLYLLPLFGVLKILGAITLIVPPLRRLKEGAYAGIIFYFIGAVYVHIAVGDSLGGMVTPAFILLMAIAAYVLDVRNQTA